MSNTTSAPTLAPATPTAAIEAVEKFWKGRCKHGLNQLLLMEGGLYEFWDGISLEKHSGWLNDPDDETPGMYVEGKYVLTLGELLLQSEDTEHSSVYEKWYEEGMKNKMISYL